MHLSPAIGFRLLSFLAVACFGEYARGGAPEDLRKSEFSYQSPRIARLAQDLLAGVPEALKNFWSQMEGKAPLIEPIADDPEYRWITFLWRGDKSMRELTIFGDIPSRDDVGSKPRRLLETDLWFRTARIPKDSRFGYAFQANGGPIQRDPLNPHSFAGRSVAELPDAPPQPWIADEPGISKGSRSQHTLSSRILNDNRAFAVYTPPKYSPQGKSCGLLIVFDGESYGYSDHSAIQTPTIIDNLLAADKIRPLVAVLLNSQKTRSRDLVCSPQFAEFLADELVPWVRERYNVSNDPMDTIVAGSSYGGLCAAFVAWKYPAVFGNVLSQSGSFRYFPGPKQDVVPYSEQTGWLTRQYVTTPRLKTQFYLQVGKFEAPLIAEHRRLRDVLEAKGCFCSYSELSGGHDYLTWRASFPDGLIALAGLKDNRILANRGRTRGSRP
jgi:enterochelin esterase-like enzyme